MFLIGEQNGLYGKNDALLNRKEFLEMVNLSEKLKNDLRF